jgi:adenine-specific DNA methylase
MKAKKLIEVAMPIKEISAESVRDKSIRHGHISTLHLWWARRPLPACRAIIFGSLVPDPQDENCPQAFRDAVNYLLNKKDWKVAQYYKPYADIPYTAVFDPMEDNLRNRLMMFIGKFSDNCQKNMIAGKSTTPKDQLSDGSLIKWENKDNPEVLRTARELIWVAYNAEKVPEYSFEKLQQEFDTYYDAIKVAEDSLYSIPNRHLASKEVTEAEKVLKDAITAFQAKMPSVFDPFSGGGAIPLEAARLGCRSFGNDINPVAHIIEKGSAEFPQKYGKPIEFTWNRFIEKYGEEGLNIVSQSGYCVRNGSDVYISNRLAFDVEYYARKLLSMTESEVGHLYPADDDGNKPIAYYWARTATCSNPSCRAEVPLLRQFYLAKTSKKTIYLNPVINGTEIQFEIKHNKLPDSLKEGWNRHTNMVCPCCGSLTDSAALKAQFNNKQTSERLLAVIVENANGKDYRLPTQREQKIVSEIPGHIERPHSRMAVGNSRNFNTPGWGYSDYGEIFSDRQIIFLNSLVKNFTILKKDFDDSEYAKAVLCYLAIWIDRIAIANTSFGVWHTGGEKLERIMGRQALPMTFDYPESQPFCKSSGSAINQLDWLLRYFESESKNPFFASFANASSGEKGQFAPKFLTAVITDPPYYDAIAYADISDFFYLWLKQTLGDIYPLNFATPQTPKTEECTALRHYHNDSIIESKVHFENKLTSIFDAIEYQTSDVVSIMFAHQSTEAWTTLCNSILGARMNITGSWPIDTEMTGALKTGMSFLESSVTVSCRPSERHGYGDFREVKRDIEHKVRNEVESLYELGFRGADLLTACFGQAVSEFGRYQAVEKADGTEVTVAELLEMVRTTAFNSLLNGINADDYTRFYIGWLQMNGVTDCDYDDATKFTRVGVSVEIADIIHEKLLVKEGNKLRLAKAIEHVGNHTNLKNLEGSNLIDKVHYAMVAYNKEDRESLLRVIKGAGASDPSAQFWRVLASLKELLPAGDDANAVQNLILNGEELRQASQKEIIAVQGVLDF